jgi:hypothetical protein
VRFKKYFSEVAARILGRDQTKAMQIALVDEIPAKRYSPVGKCIYCRSTKPPLTDEHIVPYALNGNWVLPKASCTQCSAITSSIERAVLRGELLNLRAYLNFQTRRPGTRPTTVKIVADGAEVEVPISECPIVMPFVRLPRPGRLESRPPKSGIDVIGQVAIRWGPDPSEFARQRGFKQVSLQETIAPPMFARMLAKIAYSHVVARFGLGALQDECVTSVILGQSQCIGDIVGSAAYDLPGPQNPHDHSFRPVIYTSNTSARDRLLAVWLKLFAGCPSPTYEVIIGKPADSLPDLPHDYHAE